MPCIQTEVFYTDFCIRQEASGDLLKLESHDQISWYELSAVRQCFGIFVACSQVVYLYHTSMSFHNRVERLRDN